ncbi:hypothetical protein [Virgibacillus sp. L01]|uniref:hypothetical protein n=1 Tax=Virgibacillus sp. L01 TaxID=3457429 RepID=UPI003FD3FFC6
MDSTIQTYFANLQSDDKNLQYEAFNNIIDATKVEVDWAYEIWGQLVDDLTHPNNHQRARAAQFLCSLAISDPEKRMLHDFAAVWEVTKDEKFVTARHSLQSIWKIGLAGTEQKEMVIKDLVNRFNNCTSEKNYTLIRFDIIKSLSNLYDVLNEEEIKNIALDLIEKEEDKKYRKKYSSVF